MHRNTPKMALHGDVGWEPCEVRYIADMVRLWNRFINMPDYRLTKDIFLWDFTNVKRYA